MREDLWTPAVGPHARIYHLSIGNFPIVINNRAEICIDDIIGWQITSPGNSLSSLEREEAEV